MITSSDVTNGKPDPEPYLKAAALLGFDPKKCVVIEDAPAGVRAGRSAGARVIGFPTIVGPDELRDAGANWTVRNCAAISPKPNNSSLTLILAQ
jgi:sugar-phosphatase